MRNRFDIEMASKALGIELSTHVSARLETYVDLLRRWQAGQNLVSNDTLHAVWNRHILDSLQVLPLLNDWLAIRRANMIGSPHLAGNADAPTGVVYGVDLGSGAGLPGMVLALAGYPTSDTDGTNGPALALRMTLVEATGRKASFLRTVSRETSVPVTVDNRRIEAAGRAIKTDIDFLTARALAPLDTLIKLADPWLVRGATGFFHKGGEYARELREWPDANAYDVVEHRSRIDPNSRILQITRRDADLARQA